MKFVRGHDLYILNVLCKLLFVQILSQHHPHSLDQLASCLRNLIGEGRHTPVPQRKRDIRILIRIRLKFVGLCGHTTYENNCSKPVGMAR